MNWSPYNQLPILVLISLLSTLGFLLSFCMFETLSSVTSDISDTQSVNLLTSFILFLVSVSVSLLSLPPAPTLSSSLANSWISKSTPREPPQLQPPLL